MGSRAVARPEGIEPPTLCLEGRRSIRLSYGRVGCIDSKSFMASSETILEALTFYRIGRRSIPTELQLNRATILSSRSYSDLLNSSNFSVRSIRSGNASFGMDFKAKLVRSRSRVLKRGLDSDRAALF
jgi:hypothetical protein